MTKVRVENPAPAALMVLNGKRRKNKMATSRKAKSTRRATTARRKTATPKRHSSQAIARRSNPAPRHAAHRRTAVVKSHRRVKAKTHRVGNPFRGSLLAKGIALATGAAFVQLTLGFVPPIGGVSPMADAARTAGVGWLLSLGMQRIGFLRPYADDVALAGFTLAGGKLISSFILPFANRLFAGQQAQPAMEAAPVTNQVSGIATMYPGLNPYSAYSSYDNNGMGGIAVIDPSINPYGEYAY